MYAIITDGSRQLKVEEGQELEVSYRALEAGKELTFDRVLAIGGSGDGEAKLKSGTPAISGATVVATVIGEAQGPKLVVQKFRRRKNSRRKTGHRQKLTLVKISKINAG